MWCFHFITFTYAWMWRDSFAPRLWYKYSHWAGGLLQNQTTTGILHLKCACFGLWLIAQGILLLEPTCYGLWLIKQGIYDLYQLRQCTNCTDDMNRNTLCPDVIMRCTLCMCASNVDGLYGAYNYLSTALGQKQCGSIGHDWGKL